MIRSARTEPIDQKRPHERTPGSFAGTEVSRAAVESAEDVLVARSNRAAALVVADWAWRHHEDIGAVLDMLNALGIAISDVRFRPDVIALP
jgi:hypothetical protein